MSAIFLLPVVDLETVSCDAHRAMKVFTKFEVDTTIRCLVMSSYSVIPADTLRDLVTLTFYLLTLVSGHIRRVT